MTGSSRVVVAVAVALAAACTPGARPRLGLGEICTDSSECLAGRGCFEIVSGRPPVCSEVCFGAADDCDWAAYPDAFCHSPGRPAAGYCVVPCSDDARCPGDLVCGSAGHCGPPAGGWREVAWTSPPSPGRVDMVVMVDNSGSMAQEQTELTGRFLSSFLAYALDPPDEDGDTAPDFIRAADLNLAVISSDMGVMGQRGIRSCELADRGDDGCFLNRPSRAAPWCPVRSTDKWLSRNPGNSATYSPEQMADEFACIGTLGTIGCGFEQQLEAMRKAVTENQHPGWCNEGFLRSDSVLVLLWVTDEDDCSVDPDHPEMFDPARLDLGSFCCRCFRNPSFLNTVEEYYAAFRGVGRLDPGWLIMGMIVGVPVEDPRCAGAGDELTSCLDVPLMVPTLGPAGDNLLPSCSSYEMGSASPAVRFVRLAQMWGANAVVGSVCEHDWAPTLRRVARLLGRRLSGGCLGIPVPPFDGDSCELVGCRLVEQLGDDRPCPSDPECRCVTTRCADPVTGAPCVPLRLDDGIAEVDGERRRRCIVRQAARIAGPDGCSEPVDAGWYGRPGTTPGGCVTLHVGATGEPIVEDGSRLLMECRDVP